MIDDFDEIFFVDAIDLHGFGFVNQTKQGGERITQADATTTTMADFENPFEFFI